jgi:hypothetical protein
MCALGDIFA